MLSRFGTGWSSRSSMTDVQVTLWPSWVIEPVVGSTVSRLAPRRRVNAGATSYLKGIQPCPSGLAGSGTEPDGLRGAVHMRQNRYLTCGRWQLGSASDRSGIPSGWRGPGPLQSWGSLERTSSSYSGVPGTKRVTGPEVPAWRCTYRRPRCWFGARCASGRPSGRSRRVRGIPIAGEDAPNGDIKEYPRGVPIIHELRWLGGS